MLCFVFLGNIPDIFCIIVHIIAMKQMNKKLVFFFFFFLEVNDNCKLHIFSLLSCHHFITCQPLDWTFCQSHEIYTDAFITQTSDCTTCKEDSQTRDQCCLVQQEEGIVQKKRPLKQLQHR